MVSGLSSVANFYVLDKPVSANVVISCTGAFVDQNGSSRGISSPDDLAHLVHLRKLADAVVIGGNTARKESYSPTSRFVTYVFSRSSKVPNGLLRKQFDNDADLQRSFDELTSAHEHILVEAGPSLLNKFLLAGLIDVLFVSIVHKSHECKCEMGSTTNIQAIRSLVRVFLEVPLEALLQVQIFGSTVVTRFDCGEPQRLNSKRQIA